MVEDKPTWNPEHLAIVLQGARAVADWRAEGESSPLELRGSDLCHANLSGANLSGANLSDAWLLGADLSHAALNDVNLIGANLRLANLSRAGLIDAALVRAKLSNADLSNADLRCASLNNAELNHANLSDANLRYANLSNADLSDANLSNADLSHASLSSAKFGDVRFNGANLTHTAFGGSSIEADLTGAHGLEDVRHLRPSRLSHHVLLRATERPWPIKFLRGCGLTDLEIELARSSATTPIEFYSCFVSYSSKDDKFAVKLHDALQAKGIRCWLDKHEVLPGDELQYEINKGIRLWDKVLLLCSEHSLTSPWVRKEIKRAIEKEDTLEKERGKRTLAIIPLDLDGFLFDQKRCEFDWATDMRARHAAKFVGWDADERVFDAQFGRVVKAMRADNLARPRLPDPKL